MFKSVHNCTNDIAILLKKLEIQFYSKQNISDAATVK